MAYQKIDGRLYPDAGVTNRKQGKTPQGVSVVKVEQTAVSVADGGVNVLTVTLSNGEVCAFEVRNGNRGYPGQVGRPGTDGNGIVDAQFNEDYTLTLTFDDGTCLVTPSLRGVAGPAGSPGERGLPGESGKDGYSPVRGTDYWTAADIQSMVTEAVSGVLQQKSTILEAAYPVGAIYMSAVATSPATLFGFGTWERIKDTFLLSAGDTYAAGAKGGNKSHKHTYGLKVYEYYSTAAFNPKGGLTGAINIDDGSLGTWAGGSSMAGTETLNASLGTTTASANPHHYESRATTSTETNMPPYLAVYVWKRTA